MAERIPQVPDYVEVVLTVADEAVEITFPPEASILSFYFTDNPGRISFRGPEGQAIDTGGPAMPVDADDWFVQRIRPPAPRKPSDLVPRVFVAAATVPTTLGINAEGD